MDKKDFRIIFRLKGEGDRMWQFNGFIETTEAPFGLGKIHRLIVMGDEGKRLKDFTWTIMKKIGAVTGRALRVFSSSNLNLYDRELFEFLGRKEHEEIKNWMRSFHDDGTFYGVSDSGEVYYFINLVRKNPYESYWISNIIESIEIIPN